MHLSIHISVYCYHLYRMPKPSGWCLEIGPGGVYIVPCGVYNARGVCIMLGDACMMRCGVYNARWVCIMQGCVYNARGVCI